MTSASALLTLALATSYVERAVPFAPWSTFSMEGDPYWYQIYPPQGGWLAEHPNGSLPSPVDEGAGVSAALTEFQINKSLLCRDCPVPYPDDWQTVYTVNVGLQIEQLDNRYWPDRDNSHLGKAREAIKHLKAGFQHISAVYQRDLGVELKIVHVHVMFHDASLFEPWEPMYEHWITDIFPFIEPVQAVMRLVGDSGGAGHSTCSLVVMGFASYPLLDYWHPHPDPQNYDYNSHRFSLAHELGHAALSLEHPQCYDISPMAGVQPIEKWYEPNDGCWQGASECPPCEDVSLQGYTISDCGCEGPSSPLRFGPHMGPLARIGRQHVLNVAGCTEAVFATERTLPLDQPEFAVDSDGDDFPDAMDNCVGVHNDTQIDSDMDGKGDACDGCQVAPGGGTGWPLLLPLFPLCWWRKK